MMVTGYHQYSREVRGPDPNSFALIARPGPKNASKILAERRQREEDAALAAELEKQKRLQDIRNDWVTTTDRKLKANLVRLKFQSLLQQNENDLESRRQRLRDLLAAEEEEQRRELEQQRPMFVERQDDMRERAKLLKEKRELERLAFVQKKYEQQFREGCEELRSTLTKQHTLEIAEERLQQMRVKQAIDQQQKEEDEMFARLWRADMEARNKQEEEKMKKYNSAKLETLAFLEQQIAALNEKRAEEKRLVQEEAKLWKEQEELRKIERAMEEEREKQKERDLRDMYTRSIQLKKERLAREAEEERAFDMMLLEQLFQKTQAQANVESEKKKLAQAELKQYRDYLRLLKEEEGRKEAEMERLCDLEVEKDWQKRLNKWKQEKEARQALMEEVMLARREQIEEKLQANLLKREEARKEQELLVQVIANNQRLDQEARDRLLAQSLQHKQDLLMQIAYNRKCAEFEDREEERATQVRREAEEEFRRKVEEFRRKPALEKIHPLRRNMMIRSSPSAHF